METTKNNKGNIPENTTLSDPNISFIDVEVIDSRIIKGIYGDIFEDYKIALTEVICNIQNKISLYPEIDEILKNNNIKLADILKDIEDYKSDKHLQ